MNDISVLYEDNHLLVIDKPAGLVTVGGDSGTPTAARWAADYIKRKYNKPGKAFVGVVSRLDRLVSGVLVLARTSKGASRLSAQIRDREPRKKYTAIVEGNVASDPTQPDCRTWFQLDDFVCKNEVKRRMQVCDSNTSGAVKATLRYRFRASAASRSLLDVDLITGRKHQIRLQLSALGFPIVGDEKYGARQKFNSGIALHCTEMKISHPTKKEPMAFFSSPLGHWSGIPHPLRMALESQEN